MESKGKFHIELISSENQVKLPFESKDFTGLIKEFPLKIPWLPRNSFGTIRLRPIPLG